MVSAPATPRPDPPCALAEQHHEPGPVILGDGMGVAQRMEDLNHRLARRTGQQRLVTLGGLDQLLEGQLVFARRGQPPSS